MISRKWILIGWIAGWVFSASNVVAITPERGPYLQTATPTGIVIKWRMALADASYNSIHYGTSPENLNNVATDNSFLQVDLDCGAGCTQQLVEKTVQLKGLIPHTRYYYAVGDINQPLTETEARGSFQTAPTPGAAVPIRIWVAGDSGLQSPASLQLRDNLKAFLADRPTDVLLMLGDNAYFDGTDYEHELGVFDHYPELLRHIPLWPAYGNHDAVVANALTQTGPYFDIFHLPTNGEAGGVASGTEAYYSFDHGNIHFVILDSTESDRSPGSPMFTWLESDLAANDKEWVIAYWHHPPYSKGTNDTDIIGLSIEMRQNAVSLLDQFGADMAITGHNHTYERSYFIDSHYGLSGEIVADPSLVLNGGNGRALPEPGADGAYTKSFAGGVKVPNSGMVHAVPGSTSRLSGGALNHPAMFFSTALMGSMILDVYGNRLDATFLSISGEVVDHFTIAHTPDTLSPIILSHKATQNNHVELVFSEPLDKATAEDIGNYSIDSGLVILSATLSPDGKRVDLTTAPMFSNVTYTLTVTSVKDFAGLNSIPASGIQVQFAGSNKRIFEFHD